MGTNDNLQDRERSQPRLQDVAHKESHLAGKSMLLVKFNLEKLLYMSEPKNFKCFYLVIHCNVG